MSASDAKTDPSKLITTDTVYVSADGGTTNEAFPRPNVAYGFCVDVTNGGQLPSGPFFVQFSLSGDQDPPEDMDFAQDAGLDADASITAVAHFGTFPNKFASYHREACIYSPSAPEKPINCAGSFDIITNMESTGDPRSTNSAETTGATDSTSDSRDSTAVTVCTLVEHFSP